VLQHSDLKQGAPQFWTLLGENVGNGMSMEAIFDAYYHSATHLKNILEPRFTHHSIATVKAEDDVLWTVSEFAAI
jgi:uncharacterized protein YkwD